jgi:hypothetical protein
MKLSWLLVSAFAVASCGNDVSPVAHTQLQPADSTAKVDSTSSDSLKAKPDTTRKTAPDTTVPVGDSAKPASPPVGSLDSLSPTGRAPRLVWTPQQQAVWERMRQENDPLYQVLAQNCNAAVAGSPRYGDRGLWCTIMYQITGNLTYARAAWKLAEPLVEGPPIDGNDVREYFTENAILFDWLYPALSADEREQAITGLNHWAQYALGINTPEYVGAIRIGDSDANIGSYFGLAATDLATAGLSSSHVDWLKATQTAAGEATVAVGGLDATGVNRLTLRNTIDEYVTNHGAGGEWFESSYYNLGTQILLLMGAAAVRTATKADHFPEITAYVDQAAQSQTYFTTPDLRQAPQWGDVQNARDFLGQGFRLSTLLGVISGLGHAWSAPHAADVQGLLQAVFAQYGYAGYGHAEPWARFFLFYDPYASANPVPSSTMARYFAGTGHLIVRTPQSLFDGRMSNPTFADHDLGYLRDFQLYRNGEWVVTHPIGYGGGAQFSQGNNSLLLAGLSAMSQRQSTGVQSGSNWWSISGATAGSLYAQPYWDPPPAFLRRWNSTAVYLQRGGLDIIVVQDSVDMDDPRTLPQLTRYATATQATITNAGALLQWVIHAPVNPAVNNNVASWHTAGGQPVYVYTLAPTSVTITSLPESSVLTPSAFTPSELTGYQLRIAPAFTGGSIVVRQVIIVGTDQPPPVSVSGSTVSIGATTVTFGSTVKVTN